MRYLSWLLLSILASHFFIERSTAATSEFVAISSGGTIVAKTSVKTVELWKPTSDLATFVFAQSGDVTSLDISKDGSTVAVGASDGSVTIWNGNTGQSLKVLRGHIGPVSSIKLLSNGRSVLVGDRSGIIQLLEVGSGKRLWSQDSVGSTGGGITSLAISPSEDIVAVSSGPDGGYADGVIYDVASGTLRSYGPLDAVVGFSTNRSEIISIDCCFLGAWTRAKFYAATGKLLRWQLAPRVQDRNGYRYGPFTSAAFALDGSLAAGGHLYPSHPSVVTLWDAATPQHRPPILRLLNCDCDRIESLVFSADSKFLVTWSDDALIVWDISTGEPARTLKPIGVKQ